MENQKIFLNTIIYESVTKASCKNDAITKAIRIRNQIEHISNEYSDMIGIKIKVSITDENIVFVDVIYAISVLDNNKLRKSMIRLTTALSAINYNKNSKENREFEYKLRQNKYYANRKLQERISTIKAKFSSCLKQN